MLAGYKGQSVKLPLDDLSSKIQRVSLFGEFVISIVKRSDGNGDELLIQRLLVESPKSVLLEPLQSISLNYEVKNWDILFCHPGKCNALMLTNEGWKEAAIFLCKNTNGETRHGDKEPTDCQQPQFRISAQLDVEQSTTSLPVLCQWSRNGAEYVVAFEDGRVLLRSHLQHRNLANFYPYGQLLGGCQRPSSSSSDDEDEPAPRGCAGPCVLTCVDVAPDGSRLATLCPAKARATLWRSSDQSTLVEMSAVNLRHPEFESHQQQRSKTKQRRSADYIATMGRFIRVEGAALSYKFVAIHAPLEESPLLATRPSYLAAWEASRAPYISRRVCRLPDVTRYTALGVSQEGRYLGVGDTDGRVHVYIAFSLQRLYSIRRAVDAHLLPVTELHFLPPRTADLRENDLELLSFAAETAVDGDMNSKRAVLMWHAVPARMTVSIFFVGAGFILIVFLLFYGIAYLGL